MCVGDCTRLSEGHYFSIYRCIHGYVFYGDLSLIECGCTRLLSLIIVDLLDFLTGRGMDKLDVSDGACFFYISI